VLIPGNSIPGIQTPPMPVPVQTAPPAGGLQPQAVVDAMLKLATIYRNVETDPRDKLAMERVTTLLQQIEADRHAAAEKQQSLSFGLR
jgi:hypothetical protein